MRERKLSYKGIKHLHVLLLAVLVCGSELAAQPLAFPGAEGFGKNASGGRGGTVLKVSNLNDDGPGSLRDAIEKDFPRIIVFEVSGTIYLKSTLQLTKDNVTIAGQTAPGHGITLAHYNFKIEADNVIIRHIRSRLSAAAFQEADALSCHYSSNVIIDHCSFSWSVDEVASLYFNHKLSMQNCIIAESFHNSVHSKGPHGYGGIWGGDSVSFHHNLLMHNTSRNPRFQGARNTESWIEQVDFRNNVIYNWTNNSVYGGEPSELDGSPAYYNMVNNYYKYGPSTASSIRNRILEPYKNINGYGRYFIDGNYVYAYPETTADNWTYGVQAIPVADKELMRSDTLFAYDIENLQSAEEAYLQVSQDAGVSVPYRDTVDRRLLWELVNDTALLGGKLGANTGIVDELEDVGGYPRLFSYWAPGDRDDDGIPDDWELAHGLNPDDPGDNHTVLAGSDYPALEDYINGIEAGDGDFLYHPTDFYAELTDVKEICMEWADNSADESGFIIWRSEGGTFLSMDTVASDIESYCDTMIQLDRTYTYSVQAFSESDSSVYSNSWSVETLGADGRPKKAESPVPENSANDVSITPELQWTAGVGTSSHDVYFGKTNPPIFRGNFSSSRFEPGMLEHNRRYYWRIDERNNNGTTQGDLWTFRTRSQIPRELLAHFSFDSPPSINDVSGNGITGSTVNISTADFNEGLVGDALYLEGTDQYGYYPHNEKLNFDINAFSISFWINQDLASVNKSHSHRYIVKGSNVKSEEDGKSGKRYEVFYTPEKNIFRFAVDDDINKSEVTASETIFLKGRWVHVVGIRDTTLNKVRLYSDAQLVGEVDDITGNISQTEDMYISYCVDEPGFVEGGMDEIKIFGYALSQDEINALYQEGHVGLPVSQQRNFSLYPNPNDGAFRIRMEHPVSKALNIKVLDMQGKTVTDLTDRVKSILQSGSQEVSLDLGDVTTAGVYIVLIQSPEGIQQLKFIRQ
jgi:Concanavalin A-like lectin/glucanases superfamily/Secretion system C-terminal sorting domain